VKAAISRYGRQSLTRWRPPAGGRDEQLAGRAVQAQRLGQQHRSVRAGGGVDPAFQVTDRPLAHLRRLGELVLGQPAFIAQLPQQPAELQRGMFCPRPIDHRPRAPLRPPAPASGPVRGTSMASSPSLILCLSCARYVW
jgi:hypothetical protein